MSNAECDHCKKDLDWKAVEWIRHECFCETVCPDCKRRWDALNAEKEGK